MKKQDPTLKIKKATKNELEHLPFARIGMTRSRIIKKLIDFYKKHSKK